MGVRAIKLPKPIKCQLCDQLYKISAHHMSKYRHALRDAPPLPFNKLNNNTAEQHKQVQSSAATTLVPNNHHLHAAKKSRKKLSFDRVMVVFSRIHFTCQLKFQTLCLAIQLYRKYMSISDNPEEDSVPCGHLMFICMFLSMKYSEIYPPRFKQLMPLIPTESNLMFGLAEYMKSEALVFRKLGSSLKVQTAKTILDQLLQNNSQQTYFYAYYLVQIAYHDNKVSKEFTTEQICKAVFFTMLPLQLTSRKMTQFKGVAMEDILYCSKQIISRKSKHTEEESAIYMKYCRDRYLKVALQPFVYIKLQDL